MFTKQVYFGDSQRHLLNSLDSVLVDAATTTSSGSRFPPLWGKGESYPMYFVRFPIYTAD